MLHSRSSMFTGYVRMLLWSPEKKIKRWKCISNWTYWRAQQWWLPWVILAEQRQYSQELDLQPRSWDIVVVEVHGQLSSNHLLQYGDKTDCQVLVSLGVLLPQSDMRHCGMWIVKGTYTRWNFLKVRQGKLPESCSSRCEAKPSWHQGPCRTGLYETCCVCVEPDLVLLGRIYTMPAQLSVELSL